MKRPLRRLLVRDHGMPHEEAVQVDRGRRERDLRQLEHDACLDDEVDAVDAMSTIRTTSSQPTLWRGLCAPAPDSARPAPRASGQAHLPQRATGTTWHLRWSRRQRATLLRRAWPMTGLPGGSWRRMHLRRSAGGSRSYREFYLRVWRGLSPSGACHLSRQSRLSKTWSVL